MIRLRHSIVLAALITASCAGSTEIDRVDAGRTKAYEPGLPNFDMESVVRFDEGEPVVDVYVGIPYVSLVFVRSGGHYEAGFEIDARLSGRDSGHLEAERTETVHLVFSDFDSTQSFSAHVEVVRLEATAGSYVTDVTITDAKTGELARRRQSVEIPSSDAGEPFIGRILVEGKSEDGEYRPLVALHLPSMLDSLRATVAVGYLGALEDLEVTMRLLRFLSDTTVATQPYWIVPSRASLAYQGAYFDRADTLQVTRRQLASVEDQAEVVFSLPKLGSGIYRIEIDGRDESGEAILEQERLLSIKNRSYPEIVTLEELVAALAYIAFEREIEEIEAATTPAEMKRRLDKFWGSLIPNRNAASNVIKLYYGRIEEANLLFTGYKEGWKTDRGMIYTVFGPPLYVDRNVENEIWHYSYSDRDPVNTFVFDRVRPYDDDPYENYVLQRRPYYQHDWSRAIDRWREGAVL